MEGISPADRQWYPFIHRDEVLEIGTEGDGKGGERFVFNHPAQWDIDNNRPKRVRRKSKLVIEMEARKAIDEKLDNEIRLTREKYQLIEHQLGRLHRIEELVAPGGLSLEIFLDRLVLSLQDLPSKTGLAELAGMGIERWARLAAAVATPTPCQSPGPSANTDVSGKQAAGSMISSNPGPSKADDAPASGAPAVQNPNPVSEASALIGPETQPPAGGKPKSVAIGSSHKQGRPRSNVPWPPKADFLEMLWLKPGTQIARDLGCGAPAIFARADELDLPRPDPTHWITKKFGDRVEIPEKIKNRIKQLRLQENATAPGAPSLPTKN